MFEVVRRDTLDGALNCAHLLLPKRTYSVGRLSCDINLEKPTISRMHGSFTIHEPHNDYTVDVSSSPPKITFNALGKRRVFHRRSFNDEFVHIQMNTEIEVYDGSVLRIGPENDSIYLFIKHTPFVFTGSLLNDTQVKRAFKLCEVLGSHYVPNYCTDVSHVIMSSISQPTNKVLGALIHGQPIVTVEWIVSVVDMLSKKAKVTALPAAATFLPPIKMEFTEMNISRDIFLPSPNLISRRSQLFTGSPVFFFDEEECKKRTELVSMAGGKAEFVSMPNPPGACISSQTAEATEDKYFASILQEGAVVFVSKASKSRVGMVLRRNGRHYSLPRDLGYAIIYGQRDIFCNPLVPSPTQRLAIEQSQSCDFATQSYSTQVRNVNPIITEAKKRKFRVTDPNGKKGIAETYSTSAVKKAKIAETIDSGNVHLSDSSETLKDTMKAGKLTPACIDQSDKVYNRAVLKTQSTETIDSGNVDLLIPSELSKVAMKRARMNTSAAYIDISDEVSDRTALKTTEATYEMETPLCIDKDIEVHGTAMKIDENIGTSSCTTKSMTTNSVPAIMENLMSNRSSGMLHSNHLHKNSSIETKTNLKGPQLYGKDAVICKKTPALRTLKGGWLVRTASETSTSKACVDGEAKIFRKPKVTTVETSQRQNYKRFVKNVNIVNLSALTSVRNADHNIMKPRVYNRKDYLPVTVDLLAETRMDWERMERRRIEREQASRMADEVFAWDDPLPIKKKPRKIKK